MVRINKLCTAWERGTRGDRVSVSHWGGAGWDLSMTWGGWKRGRQRVPFLHGQSPHGWTHHILEVLACLAEEVDSNSCADDMGAVAPLLRNLDEAIAAVGGRAFVKAGVRSPKDIVYDEIEPRALAKFRALLQQWDDHQDHSATIDANKTEVAETRPRPSTMGERKHQNSQNDEEHQEDIDILRYPHLLRQLRPFREQHAVNSFLKAAREGFLVTDAQQALRALLRSSRFNLDANRACEARTPFCLAVRRFELVEPETEFRVFVCDGRVTAVSQYFHRCFFPKLAAARRSVVRRLLAFFERVVAPVLPPRDSDGGEVLVTGRATLDGGSAAFDGALDGGSASGSTRAEGKGIEAGRLKTRSFVIDLVVPVGFGDMQEPVKIIELNPFRESTSGCLFDWGQDKTILRRDAEEGRKTPLPAEVLQWYQAYKQPPAGGEGIGVPPSDPVCVRIIQCLVPKAIEYLVPSWRRIAQSWVSSAEQSP